MCVIATERGAGDISVGVITRLSPFNGIHRLLCCWCCVALLHASQRFACSQAQLHSIPGTKLIFLRILVRVIEWKACTILLNRHISPSFFSLLNITGDHS